MSTTYPLRIEEKLLKRVKKRAMVDNRTIASLFRHAMTCYLDGTATCEHCEEEIRRDSDYDQFPTRTKERPNS